ncbi:MAG TPA: hypothetical protein VG738_08720 [Chitinophagaceae bacterium]|nr:hypothetical protein [Chitinophagaceae bacterium]
MKYKNIIITVAIVIAAGTVFYGVAVYKKSSPQAGTVSNAINVQPDSTARLDTTLVAVAQLPDPCKGTGGTGQIISVEDNGITIRRHDGVSEVIKLTDKTIIKNSAGPLSKSGLKAGDNVTVVVMSNHTATVVLVCNG